MRIVVLTATTDRRLLNDAKAAGAAGYLFKDGTVTELLATVRHVAARGLSGGATPP